ncbi:MAG TPA: hypothetical protein VFY43_07345, partial [Candidatus Limnocylindria bacterium]|nr:hypothetical protein [Candidatus Limnocylindria bacterium]
ILYDLGIIGGVNPEDPTAGFPSYDSLEGARVALGDVRRLAQRLDLAAMLPASAISSTRYALANPGREYVVFQPEEGTISVDLPAGSYASESFGLADRAWQPGELIAIEGTGPTAFAAPESGGPWVLHLEED